MTLSTDTVTQLLEREAAKEGKAFTWQQLKEAYIALAARRELLPAPRFDRVLGALLLTGRLRQVEVRPEKKKRQDRSSYKPFIRYTLSGATALDLAASLRPGGYFSHSTAATLHGLLEAEAIYINKEQSEKPSSTGSLTQEAIDRAFSNAPRVSRYAYIYEGKRIVLLSGKNTSDFEVIERSEHGSVLRYTSLERTLFDMTVRPTYAGGVSNVLKAFSVAKAQIDISRLLKVLKRIDHLYPYHQAIGFYLHRAGVREGDLKEFKRLGMEFNFYLANGMNKPKLDPEWRIFFPSDLHG